MTTRYSGYNKVKARTQGINACVRVTLCCFILTLSFAFLATTLQPYRDLKKLRAHFDSEVKVQENHAIEQVDEKQREYSAIESDPEYLGLIARDRLNYYKPGEQVFRIEK